MKKYIAIIISIALAVSLCGCGADADTQSSTASEKPAEEPSAEPAKTADNIDGADWRTTGMVSDWLTLKSGNDDWKICVCYIGNPGEYKSVDLYEDDETQSLIQSIELPVSNVSEIKVKAFDLGGDDSEDISIYAKDKDGNEYTWFYERTGEGEFKPYAEGDQDDETGLADEDFVEASDVKKEENNDDSFTRAAEDMEETEYTADDVAGYWKYENLDNIYVAIYDTGIYEIYDMKSGDVKSDGTYTVDGEGIVMTETGKDDGEYLQIESMVRLIDDQGDALVPYAPEGSIGASDESGDGKVSRATGSLDSIDDLVTDDIGKGFYKTKSVSRGCYIKYPFNYYCGAEDDFLYVADGYGAYATARNITSRYNSYDGTAKQFMDSTADGTLIRDFKYFFGDKTGYAEMHRKYNTSNTHLCEENVNLWNGKYDIQAKSIIFLSKFDDGDQYIIEINYFWTYGDKNSYNRIKNVMAGAVR